MKQKYKPTQYVEISMHEIFCFQDKLDAAKDDPERVWEIVNEFFKEAESQLELNPNFIKELQSFDKNENVDIKNIDELLNDEKFATNYLTAHDYVNYILHLNESTK